MRLALALLALASAPAAAQHSPPDAVPGSALAVIEASVATLDSLDAELARATHRLSAAVLSSDAESQSNRGVAVALEAEAASWRRYRTGECRLVGAMTGAGGSWPSAWALSCEVEQAAARLAAVRAATACTEALPADARVSDDGACLRGIVAFGGPMESPAE